MIVLGLAPQRFLADLAADPIRQPVIDEILAQGGVDVVADPPARRPRQGWQQREMTDDLDLVGAQIRLGEEGPQKGFGVLKAARSRAACHATEVPDEPLEAQVFRSQRQTGGQESLLLARPEKEVRNAAPCVDPVRIADHGQDARDLTHGRSAR